MFIHFAFSSLKDDPAEQIAAAIGHILGFKRLKYGSNPEFIPVFQTHLHPRFKGKEVRQISLDSFKPSKDGAVADSNDMRFIKPENNVYFLPHQMRMLCFINIPFMQLYRSPHHLWYGKFGLVLTDEFLKKNGMMEVQYYEESSLFADSLIVGWNLKFGYKPDLNSSEMKEKLGIETQILAFRKPATLFNSFRESRLLAVRKVDEHQTVIKIVDAYDRYPIGYDFREEKEWRIFSYTDEFLSFSENDLFMVIVPDERCKSILNKHFRENWKIVPRIEIFPAV